jgi:hypothetical protein
LRAIQEVAPRGGCGQANWSWLNSSRLLFNTYRPKLSSPWSNFPDLSDCKSPPSPYIKGVGQAYLHIGGTILDFGFWILDQHQSKIRNPKSKMAVSLINAFALIKGGPDRSLNQ